MSFPKILISLMTVNSGISYLIIYLEQKSGAPAEVVQMKLRNQNWVSVFHIGLVSALIYFSRA